jgi:hypothetical protein
MSRGVFNSLNKEVEVFMFQTYSSSADTFNPTVSLNVGGDRVLWSLGDGSQYVAGNGLSYVYTDSGTTKTVKLLVPKLKRINGFIAQSKKIKGNLDASGLIGMTSSSNFFIDGNPQLTGFTQPNITTNIRQFSFAACNIIGNLNLSNVIIGSTSLLGGTLQGAFNVNLTGITQSPSNLLITNYNFNGCDLTGTLDVSNLTKLGGSFLVADNPNLNSIIHTASTSTINITQYYISSCDIQNTHDISMLNNFGGLTSTSPGYFFCYNNSNLTNVLLPNVNNFFRNTSNIESASAFAMYSCNLDYIDFKPLSGSTLLTGSTQGNPRISLRDNSMSAGDVNHILVDFSGNTTVNPVGWSNVNLNIGGTNADPDSSSGGYDGLAAIAFLTGSPYNWTITY